MLEWEYHGRENIGMGPGNIYKCLALNTMQLFPQYRSPVRHLSLTQFPPRLLPHQKSEGRVTQQWLKVSEHCRLKRRRAPSPRVLLQTETKRGKNLYFQESIPLNDFTGRVFSP